MEQSGLRVGDDDRDAVAQTLRDHWAEGRLTIEELDERIEAAYQASTRSELAAVTADLPLREPLPPSAHPPQRKFFWPGVEPFHEERPLRASCQASFAAALNEMVPRLGMQGFHVVDELWPRRLRFADGSGLLVTVMFLPAADGGTIVTAFGHAPRAVRKAFATLRD